MRRHPFLQLITFDLTSKENVQINKTVTEADPTKTAATCSFFLLQISFKFGKCRNKH
jgi:hypothetical protein